MALPFPTHTDCKFCLLITGVKNSSSTIYFYLGPLSKNLYIDVLSSSPYANSHNLMPARGALFTLPSLFTTLGSRWLFFAASSPPL